MFSACKTFEFEAGHYLPGYDGACKNKHGHSYVLQVEVVGGPMLYETGMIVDFTILKDVVKKLIVDKFDHSWLNDSFSMPTAENMVRKIVEILDNDRLWPLGVFLQRVRLYETRTSYIEWRRP